VDKEARRVLKLDAGDVSTSIDDARGGRLASLRIGGRELLVGPSGPDDSSITWGCYLMAPWPGRLADGRLRWGDGTIQLRRTHGRHAIHGLVSGVPWTVDAVDAASAELSVSLDRDGWPFGGLVRQRIRLEPDRLVLEAEIHADAPMPAALGWHPWFRRREAPRVRVDGDTVLEARRMIPTGRLLPVEGLLDLRAGPALGRVRLDHTYVGVRAPLEIAWPDLTLRLETEPWLSTVVVYTPSGAVCVEPQTAWPNALGLDAKAALAAGGVVLAAGASLRASLALSWRLAPRDRPSRDTPEEY
jgi:aldose 1-epimerase